MSRSKNTMSVKGWLKPSAKYTQSRLLELPAELQIIILRELLVTEQPIGHRDEYFTPVFEVNVRRTKRLTKNQYATPKQEPKKVTGYHLYPQILLTCQSLSVIGTPILYNENRLEIKFDSGSDASRHCGGHCRALAIAQVTAKSEDFLAAVQPRFKRPDSVDVGSELLAFASKFGKYYIKAYHLRADYVSSQREAPTASGIFRLLVTADLSSIFSGKNIVANVISRPNMTLSTVSTQLLSALKSFQSLRCKSFEFEDKTGDLKSLYEMIEDVIKGNTPVVDFKDILDHVRTIEQPLLSMVQGDETRKDKLRSKFKKLADAMYTRDTKKFIKLRKEVVNEFKKEVRKVRSQFETDDETLANVEQEQVDAKENII